MADYWVSQTRKYCEFCRCWITDNKPSVDFHEKGRRHQANVQKKLRNITKHSTQVQKSTNNFNATLRIMENAAIESYKKDIEMSGDITSMAIRNKLRDSGGGHIPKKLWHEKRTRDGKTHYVNIMTNQTVWTAPFDGFMSIAEQQEESLKEAQKQLKEVEKERRKQALILMQEIKHEEEEARSRLVREKMKEYRAVTEDVPATTSGPLLELGKTNPYGRWQTVAEKPLIDYQLPEQAEYPELPVEYEPEPIVKEFAQKQVQSLNYDNEENGSQSTTFKKRKIVGGAKRNARQRLNDE